MKFYIKFFYFLFFIFGIYHLIYEFNYGFQISRLKYKAPNYSLESCMCLYPLSEYWGIKNKKCLDQFRTFQVAANYCIKGE